jgi:hypothetical protein
VDTAGILGYDRTWDNLEESEDLMASPFLRRKLALGFYSLNLSRDGVLKTEDMAEYARKVAEQLRPNEEPARERLVTAFQMLWEVYCQPHDKDGDQAITFDDFIGGHEALRQFRETGSTADSSNVTS